MQGVDFLSVDVRHVDVAEGEVGEAHCRRATVVDAVVASEIEEVHIAYFQFTQPRGISGVYAS